MDTGRQQIDLFLKKCDELMQSKFIIADTKIGELLKAIATSDLLYAFFREITKNFDYPAAREKYMNYMPEGTVNKRKLLFPENAEERLAFVFCLFVDFDAGRIDLGAFLQEYFYEDGSVYGSFYAFSNQVVKPFRNAVRTLFYGGRIARGKAEGRGELAAFASREREAVYASRLPDARKVEALVILNALSAQAEKGDARLIAALITGYRCFAEAAGWKSGALLQIAEKYAGPEVLA